MTLGAAATAGVRLTVWCKGCPRQARLTSRRGQTIPRSDFGSRLAAAGHRRPRGLYLQARLAAVAPGASLGWPRARAPGFGLVVIGLERPTCGKPAQRRRQ